MLHRPGASSIKNAEFGHSVSFGKPEAAGASVIPLTFQELILRLQTSGGGMFFDF
jgi:hypothetical protein